MKGGDYREVGLGWRVTGSMSLWVSPHIHTCCFCGRWSCWPSHSPPGFRWEAASLPIQPQTSWEDHSWLLSWPPAGHLQARGQRQDPHLLRGVEGSLCFELTGPGVCAAALTCSGQAARDPRCPGFCFSPAPPPTVVSICRPPKFAWQKLPSTNICGAPTVCQALF